MYCSDFLVLIYIRWYCVTAGARYISISSYQASRDDELSFVKGAVVKVLKKYIDGWWLVRYADILLTVLHDVSVVYVLRYPAVSYH